MGGEARLQLPAPVVQEPVPPSGVHLRLRVRLEHAQVRGQQGSRDRSRPSLCQEVKMISCCQPCKICAKVFCVACKIEVISITEFAFVRIVFLLLRFFSYITVTIHYLQ